MKSQPTLHRALWFHLLPGSSRSEIPNNVLIGCNSSFGKLRSFPSHTCDLCTSVKQCVSSIPFLKHVSSSLSGLLCWWIFIVPEVVLNLVSIFSGLAALMSADIARNL